MPPNLNLTKVYFGVYFPFGAGIVLGTGSRTYAEASRPP